VKTVKATLLWMMIAMIAPAFAAQPQQGDFVVKDFRYHTGEVAELHQHYSTLGDPRNPAVLVLHGTNGTGAGMLNPSFGGALFGAGQPLDSAKYFIIAPDSIGAGKSSKPSDGLRQKFPRYTYDDMVAAQYRLLTEHLGVKHLRLVTGNSMGGMVTWVWTTARPDFMDAAVPLASQPAAMASRNWAMRRLVIETIKADPAFHNGDYTAQPPSLKYASAFFGVATSGGTLGWQARAGTHATADKAIDDILAAPDSSDANDVIYQFDAARDYDPAPKLDAIKAWVLAINSADDERNPPETGTTEQGVAKLAHGKYYLIPASAQTHGHGTTGNAALWRDQLAAWLPMVPKH
jgi:homoserine O-acetyltransferase